MLRLRLHAFLALLALTLIGCQGLPLLGIDSRPSPEPSFWYEANPTQIASVEGPGIAVAGTPVVLAARVIIGSSSCDRFKELRATVDEASRSVVLSAMRESKRSDQELACTEDYGSKVATVSVTLPSAGTYRVSAERYHPVSFLPDETPRATLDIVVTAGQ
ncbi:MAG TPA: hypothetical protein V6D00_07365 [Pantanalinema sp.]